MGSTSDGKTVRVEKTRPSSIPPPPGLLRFFPLGATPGMSFVALLSGGGWIGREQGCEVRLDDDKVSRRHARVEQAGGQWRIADNDSANGISVNGVEVPAASLTGGEVIRVGDTLLRFLSRGTARSSAEHPISPAAMVAGPALDEVRELLGRAAGSELSVLICGETGTGKELAARHLHDEGPRRDGPFVAVNCSAIPAEILESELFGHVKGAFTGAASARRGLIRDASGGSLFLDEIGELPRASQAKLLRVLQQRRVRPVGGDRDLPVDIRLVCATNRQLGRMVEQAQFRPDLYARLAELVLTLPPLRQRIEDVPLLVQHFLAKHSAAGDEVSVDALEALCCRGWPFNIRELESAVRRALLLRGARAGELEPAHFAEAEMAPGSIPEGAPDRAEGGASATPPAPASVQENPQADGLRQALQRFEGDTRQAAEALGISRSQVYRRARQFGIVIKHYRP